MPSLHASTLQPALPHQSRQIVQDFPWLTLLTFVKDRRRTRRCIRKAIEYALGYSLAHLQQYITPMFLQELQYLREDRMLGFFDVVESINRGQNGQSRVSESRLTPSSYSQLLYLWGKELITRCRILLARHASHVLRKAYSSVF